MNPELEQIIEGHCKASDSKDPVGVDPFDVETAASRFSLPHRLRPPGQMIPMYAPERERRQTDPA